MTCARHFEKGTCLFAFNVLPCLLGLVAVVQVMLPGAVDIAFGDSWAAVLCDVYVHVQIVLHCHI